MQFQFLHQEDILEKGMATHSSILVWKIPCTEEPGGLEPTDLQRVRHDSAHTHTHKPPPHTHIRQLNDMFLFISVINV